MLDQFVCLLRNAKNDRILLEVRRSGRFASLNLTRAFPNRRVVVAFGLLLLLTAGGLASFALMAARAVHAQSLPSYAARSGLPSFRLAQPSATITPGDALAYYGSPSVPDHAAISPRITALARALEHNPDRIYQFVRNSIEFEPQFGLHKGGDGVLLDGAGGAFDQAQLMVQLARASGYGARYGLGVKTLGTEAASILKVANARQACLLLAAAGTPALVNGQTACTGLSGAVSSVEMLHVWPEIMIGGSWYAFDPALKTHTRVNGIDVWASANTTAGSAWVNLMSGISVNQANVTGIDPSSIASKMATYTTVLQADLAANHSNKSLAEVTGGWTINRSYAVLRDGQLSGATVNAHWNGDIPVPYRATIRFHTDNFIQTFDLANMYAYRVQAQISGDAFKLAIRRCDSSDASPSAYFGAFVDSGPASACEAQNTFGGVGGGSNFNAWDRRLDILVNHPYAANGGSWADEEVSKSIEIGKRVDIVIRTAGGQGVRRATHAASVDPLLDLRIVAEGAPHECAEYGGPGPNQQIQVDDNCATNEGAEDWNYWVQDNVKFVKGHVVAAEMKSRKDSVVNLWTELFDTMTAATEGLSGARIFHQHSIGVALNPSYGPTMLDIDTAVGVAPGDGDQPHQIASALASLASAAEAAAVAQITADEYGSGGGATNGGRVMATGTTLTRLNPGQSSASLPAGVIGSVRTRVDSYLSAGYSVVVPEQASGGFFARRWEGSEYAWIVGSGTKGTPTSNNVDPRNDFRKGATDSPRPLDFLGSAEASAIAANVAGSRLGSVDLRTGSLSFAEGDELTVGQGEFPYSLTFNRRYASTGPASSFGELGAGWTHNWESSAYRRSDVGALIQASDVVSSAPTVIGVLVALQAGRSDSIEHSLVSGIALNWWQDEGIDNIVLLNGGGRSGRFTRLANGIWRNSGAPTETLALSGSSQVSPEVFEWTLADKSLMRFERFAVQPSSPYYNDVEARSRGRVALKTWTFRSGLIINLAYTSSSPTNPPYLASVSNNVGSTLSFSYSQNPDQPTTANCLSNANVYSDPYSERKACRLAAQRGGRLIGVTNGSASVGFGYLEDCHLSTSYCAYYLTVATRTLSRTRSYTYEQPPGAATPHIFGYQRLLTTVSDDGVITPRARFVWSAVAGEYAPEVREGYDAQNRKTTYFSSRGHFSTAEDALTHRVRQAYDPDGRLTDASDAMGRTSRQAYYGSGRIRQVQAAWGNRTKFTYDNRGNTISTVRTARDGCIGDVWWCQNITVTAEYDAYWNKPTRITLPVTSEGQATTDWTITYDSRGLEEVRRGGSVFDGRYGGYTHPEWKTWYDDRGRVLRTQDPVGIETAQVWGGAGQPAFCLTQSRTASQDPAYNFQTNMTCNSVGDVTSVMNPRSHIITTTWYDALRRKTDEVGPAGTNINSHWVYDPDGNMTEAWAWDQPANTWRITRTSYSATGTPLTVTDPQGDVSRTCYDAVDRPIVTVDAAWRATKTTYNPAGQSTQIERWLIANPSDATCAVFAQLPAGQTSTIWRSFQYYTEGLQYAELDARGNATVSAYDGLGRNVHTTFADGSWEFLFVNQRDQVIAKRARSNEWRQIFFDDIGRPHHVWEAPNTAASPASWPNGRHARVNYDPAGKPVYRDVSDQGNGVWEDGLLRDKRTYGFDAAGRVTVDVVQPFNGGMAAGQSLAIGYGYDSAGNRTSITWPGGYTATYQFDAVNRPTQVAFGGNWANTTYDSLSRRTNVSRSNNTSTAWAYEPDSDLFTATHNFPGWPGQLVQGYTHDPAGKLTAISHSVNGFEWQPADGYARTYGVANVLNQTTSQAGVGIGWDANGNMTSDGVNTYVWGTGNRLAAVTRPGMSAFYHYDSEDRRTLKTVDGVMTRTLWSGTEPIAQYDTNGTLLRLIIPDGSGAMDGRVAVVENGGDLRWQHTDHQGSVIVLTDGSGTVRQVNRYGPHGETASLGGSTGVGGIFGYTGREFDPESGLYQYRARYYSPLLGLFLSTDPIGTQDDPNLYLYVGGDPVNATDPEGEQARPVRAPSTRAVPPPQVYIDRLGQVTVVRPLPLVPRPQGQRPTNFRENGPVGQTSAGPAPRTRGSSAYSVAFEAQLPPENLRGSRGSHNQISNEQLSEAMRDAGLKGMMNRLGVQDPISGNGSVSRTSQPGWTWHHGETPGQMQLVPTPQHRDPALRPLLHPGGRGGYSQWGKPE
ncbi:RHS repeat-associated core domain-containing protein [Brevundimonas sp.]|uniref:RHS repeat-associated core domain-containing protein n=1 Tax=Brevundimonas sp. TaxID=1871086 RepID=UPI001A2A46C1|nr:RHS repeat-associated core domain-containing protein [Brevundimonas sp.]MBJ7484084.1 HNH endonuclease [Brevundimonas sp.]